MNTLQSNVSIQKIATFFSTGFYVGYFPFASGTVASFVALIPYLFIPGFESTTFLIPLILGFTLIGIWTGNIAEKKFGFDPPEVVIDEFVGMWITLLFLPKTLLLTAIAFFLFRVFDITKPFPARKMQNLNGGIGIMFDDVVAGIYGIISIQLLIIIFPGISTL